MTPPSESGRSGTRKLFGRRKIQEQPAAVSTPSGELAESINQERNITLAKDILNSRLGLITRFAIEPHEPGAGLTLYRDQEGIRWAPGIGELVVQGLYESLGHEVPPKLDAEDPEVKHELGQFRQYSVSFDGQFGWVIKENNTPITTRIQLSPDLALERITTFTWWNSTAKVTGISEVHKLVKTEPNPEAVGTVVNDFWHKRYESQPRSN